MAVAAEVLLVNEAGLHARPAVKFTKLAKRHAAAISLQVLPDGEPCDAKSINRVMRAKARCGQRLRIVADGADAQDAVSALRELIESGFADG